MNVQTTMFEEKKAARIVCEHCGAVFVMYPETARDFYKVHACYQETQKPPVEYRGMATTHYQYSTCGVSGVGICCRQTNGSHHGGDAAR